MKKNFDNTNSTKSKIGQRVSDKVSDDKLILRAKENIFSARFMQKEEKEKRFFEDVQLLMSKGNSGSRTEEDKILNPHEFILFQNYPNPFNPVTNINFEIPTGSQVTLKVFDITGKQVRVLLNEYKQKGNYNIMFDGQNLSSGVYYYKLESGILSAIKKMVLIK